MGYLDTRVPAAAFTPMLFQAATMPGEHDTYSVGCSSLMCIQHRQTFHRS